MNLSRRYRFVDKQICGPYSLGIHEHAFPALDGREVGRLCFGLVVLVVEARLPLHRHHLDHQLHADALRKRDGHARGEARTLVGHAPPDIA